MVELGARMETVIDRGGCTGFTAISLQVHLCGSYTIKTALQKHHNTAQPWPMSILPGCSTATEFSEFTNYLHILRSVPHTTLAPSWQRCDACSLDPTHLFSTPLQNYTNL